jgi:YesN/AraC family two-component response regulator
MSRTVSILIIDDEEVVLMGVKKILHHDQSYNYDVDFAFSAEEALEKSESNEYDIIISDIVMRGMDGMELLQIFMDRDISAQIIMFTGYATMKTALIALKMGAFDFIAKPFTSDELYSSLHRALHTESKKREVRSQTLEDKNIIQPPYVYSIPGHTWAKIREDYTAFIGIEKDFLDSISEIEKIEVLNIGEQMVQGYGFGSITSESKRVYKLPSPLSGKVIAVNNDLTADIKKINDFTSYHGWLLHIEPTELEKEISNLILTE